MKKYGKRFLSLALALLMMLSMLTGIVLPASAESAAVEYADAADGDLLYTVNFNFDSVYKSANFGIAEGEYTVSGDNGERLTFSGKPAGTDMYNGRLAGYRIVGNVYTLSYYLENSDFSNIQAGVQFIQHNLRLGLTNAKTADGQLLLLLNSYNREKLNPISYKTDTENNNRRYFKVLVDGVKGVMSFYALNTEEEYQWLGNLDLDIQNTSFINDYLRFGLYCDDAVDADQTVALGDVQIFKGNTVTEKTAYQTAYDAAADGEVLYDIDFNDIVNNTDGWDAFIPAEKAEGISVSEDGEVLTLANTYNAKQYVTAAHPDHSAAQYGSFTYEFYMESNNRAGVWFMGTTANGSNYRMGFSYFNQAEPERLFMVANDFLTREKYEAGATYSRDYYRGAAVVETQFGAEINADQTPDTGENIDCNVKVEYDAVNKKMSTYILKNGAFKKTASFYYAGTSFYPVFGVYTYDNGTTASVKNLVVKKGLAADVPVGVKGLSFERISCRDGYYTRTYPTENYYSAPVYLENLPQTFGMWLKPAESGYGTLNHAFTLASRKKMIQLSIQNGTPMIQYGRIEWTISGVKLTSEAWSHLAFTYDPAAREIRFYLNGELVDTYTSTSELASTELDGEPGYIYVGGMDGTLDSQLNRNAFVGEMGDIFMYKDIRTAEELQADMIAFDPEDTDMKACYKLFGAKNGKDIVDLTGNGYDVTSGATWLSEEDMEAKRAQDTNEYAFSLAVLPDTQKMLDHPEKYVGMFDWMLANKESKNIQFVLNMGDMTDESTSAQWALVKEQHERLNDIIPYNVLQGNHDKASDTNATFGDKEGYYYQWLQQNGGSYSANSVLNTYQLFSAGKNDYIIINIGYDFEEYEPVLQWASDILDRYADRKAIIVTHHLMGASFQQHNSIWPMAKKHANVFLMLGGHIVTDFVVRRTDYGDHGNAIQQILIDPQSTDSYMDGLGAVAMLYFTEDGEDVAVETYSTVTGSYYRAQNQQTFSYDCYDSPLDGDHICDSCGAENVTLCTNDVMDHVCDTDSKCAVYTAGEWLCADSDDEDHFCDICGIGVKGPDCTDVADDEDHKCDVCGADEITACSDAAGDGDHKCDVCGKDYVYAPDYTSYSTANISGYEGGIKYVGPVSAKTYSRAITDYTPNRKYEITYAVEGGRGTALSIVFGRRSASATDDTRLGWWLENNLTDVTYFTNTTSIKTVTGPERDVIDGKQYFKVILDGTSMTMSLYALSGGEYVHVHTRQLYGITAFRFGVHNQYALTAGKVMEVSDISLRELCTDTDDHDHKCDECGADGITACSDVTGDGDHKCDECGVEGITTCADASDDDDHFCDECGLGVKGADCTDVTGDGDHKCDVCAADEITACSDSSSDSDHLCDDCGEIFRRTPDFSGSSNNTTLFGYDGGIKYVGPLDAKTYTKYTATYTANRKYEITYAMKGGKGTSLSIVYGRRSETATDDTRLGWQLGGNLTDMTYYTNATAIKTVSGPVRDVIDGKQYFKVILDGVSMTMSLYTLSGGEYVHVHTRQLYGITRFLFGVHNQNALAEGDVMEVSDISMRELCSDADADHKCDVCAAELPELHQESELIVDTAATVTTDGVGHTECTVCGAIMQSNIVIPFTGVAMNGETVYPTVEEAMAAAQSGDTVVLCKDVQTNVITLYPDIALDLNGNTLTADYVVGLKRSALIDSSEDNGGRLYIQKDHVALDLNNDGYLPVYNAGSEGVGYYSFTTVKLQGRSAFMDATSYAFSPVFETFVHEALMAGKETTGVRIVIRLNWEEEGNYEAEQDFTYVNDMVRTVIGSYNAEGYENNYGRAFSATFEGSEAGEAQNVQVTAVVVSDTGVEIAGTPACYAGV